MVWARQRNKGNGGLEKTKGQGWFGQDKRERATVVWRRQKGRGGLGKTKLQGRGGLGKTVEQYGFFAQFWFLRAERAWARANVWREARKGSRTFQLFLRCFFYLREATLRTE